jgi:hypothetical protein
MEAVVADVAMLKRHLREASDSFRQARVAIFDRRMAKESDGLRPTSNSDRCKRVTRAEAKQRGTVGLDYSRQGPWC